jgi:hypothetical protein
MKSKTPPKMVYFMRHVDDIGPIKIGCSSNVETRVKYLSRELKTPLKVLAVVDGGHALENWLHYCFGGSNVCLEWFEPEPRLLAMIDDILLGRFAEPFGPFLKRNREALPKHNVSRKTLYGDIPWHRLTRQQKAERDAITRHQVKQIDEFKKRLTMQISHRLFATNKGEA